MRAPKYGAIKKTDICNLNFLWSPSQSTKKLALLDIQSNNFHYNPYMQNIVHIRQRSILRQIIVMN